MIRKATQNDLQTIMKLVSETVTLMQEENNDQWDSTYPTHHIFEQDHQNGTLYVVENGNLVIGSITVDQNQPEEYAPIEWRNGNTAAFVFHRLVVSTSVRKKGIASALITFAEKHAKKNDASSMRIDTYSLNHQAQKLFEKMGYIKVGEMTFHGKGNPFYCYEKLI